ncbi:hypothetical protein [Planobispora longispora]|nr:hypothetical protein [Planobispora longispora]
MLLSHLTPPVAAAGTPGLRPAGIPVSTLARRSAVPDVGALDDDGPACRENEGGHRADHSATP